MTNRNLFDLFNALMNISAISKSNFKFGWAVARNLKNLSPIIDTLREPLKGTDEYQEYEKARMDLIRKYGKTDEKTGRQAMYMEGNQSEYVILKPKEYRADIKELQKEHKKAFDIHQKVIKDFEEKLDEKCDEKVKLYKVDSEHIPREYDKDKEGNKVKNGEERMLLTPGQLAGVMDIING